MPIYEYRCNKCRRKASLYVKGFSGIADPTCPHCGSKEMSRLFSTFAMVKTDHDVYENILNDSDLVNRMMANDPKAMLEWSRRMGGTEGEKEPEYQEMVERLERGDSMDSVVSDFQKREFGGDESPDMSSEGGED
jgi:putative FmdB family regulatory protein